MKIIIIDSNIVFSKLLATAIKSESNDVEIDIINNQILLRRRLEQNKYDLIIAEIFCTCGNKCRELIIESKCKIIWTTANTIQIDSNWILSVDDDDSDAALISHQLKNIPQAKVVRAKDGNQAIEILMAATDKPKFILLDINMPNMDGMEFLKIIRAKSMFADVPIIIVSAFLLEPREAFDNGVDAIVEKPIDIVCLFDKINDCVIDFRKPKTGSEFKDVAKKIMGVQGA